MKMISKGTMTMDFRGMLKVGSLGKALLVGVVGMMLLSSALADTPTAEAGNVTIQDASNTTSNTTAGTGKEANDHWDGLEWKVCVVIAVILTTVAGVFCFHIKRKADSGGYASGNNMPKALGGMTDDF